MSSEKLKINSQTPIIGKVKAAYMKPQTQTPRDSVAPPPAAKPTTTPTAKK